MPFHGFSRGMFQFGLGLCTPHLPSQRIAPGTAPKMLRGRSRVPCNPDVYKAKFLNTYQYRLAKYIFLTGSWVYLKTHLNTFDTKPSSYVWKFVLQHLKKAPAPSHAGLEYSFPRNCFRYLDFGASNVTISMVNRMGSQIQDISIESLSPHFLRTEFG